MSIYINRNTEFETEVHTSPVEAALSSLRRDIIKTCVPTEQPGAKIVLLYGEQERECFLLRASGDRIELIASDDLGFVYGIYEISRSILGVENFWFWNDQKFEARETYPVAEEFKIQSKPARVKYRGWFVNDEILLIGWNVERSREKAWEMVFEALLRCGGNMTIPGTDTNSKIYRYTAARMGLWITHHHAEPLGAEMFIRAYPDLKPSYVEHADKFQQLWREGVEQQKDLKVIWNLGFRGQGDYPFWLVDPQYQTMESRGKLMSDIIKMQYDTVKEIVPDAVCCTNLYGETMELYRDGYLKLPDDVIKIWADNGFGKMVTRRQENHNPRIYALPALEDAGRHGIYYHVSFYDLQAASQLTMLPNSPEFVKKELTEVLEHHADDYWIVNCSNVKPHVYLLDFVSKMWTDGTVSVESHRRDYVSTYYGAENEKKVSKCLAVYPKYAPAYGKHEDEHAGEQFSNHVTRMLVTQYMTDRKKPSEWLLWATDAPTLKEQILWYRDICKKAAEGYQEYLDLCIHTLTELSDAGRMLFEDSIMLQVKIHYHCYRGALHACESLLLALDKEYKRAFYEAGKSKEEFTKGNAVMRAREHGKWHDFYQNDCQADVKQSAWVLGGLMSYLRTLGDGPHFYLWQREFEDTEEDQRVMLLLTTKNHPTDWELYELMKQKWDD